MAYHWKFNHSLEERNSCVALFTDYETQSIVFLTTFLVTNLSKEFVVLINTSIFLIDKSTYRVESSEMITSETK